MYRGRCRRILRHRGRGNSVRQLVKIASLPGLLMIFAPDTLAATVSGNVFLDGQSDHSGISIVLSLMPPPPIPALGSVGMALLLITMGLAVFRKRLPRTTVLLLVTGSACVGCLVYAFTDYSTTTDISGAYAFPEVEPGEYSLTASKTGFHTETRDNLVILDGANTLPDLTLYPEPNQPPEAGNVIVVGAPAVSRSITVHYDYFDAEGDPEGASLMEWQFDVPPFSNPVTLLSGTGHTVQIPDEEDLYVRVAVTPYAVTGTLIGPTAWSGWLGPIASADAVTVFHIGNSFTRWGHIALQVKNLAEDAGNPHVYGEQITDGRGLNYHWANGLAGGVWTRGTPSRLELETGSWDWLVLQPMSREWQPDRLDGFIQYAMLFSELATSHGTQVLLYEYWNYLDEGPEIQDEIDEGFEIVREVLAAGGYNVSVIPVGDAFLRALDEIPALTRPDMYQDNIHPSDPGYYLSALVHFSVIYDQSPAGLTNIAVSASPWNDDPVAIDPALAAALQDVAWATVNASSFTSRLALNPEPQTLNPTSPPRSPRNRTRQPRRPALSCRDSPKPHTRQYRRLSRHPPATQSPAEPSPATILPERRSRTNPDRW